MSSPNQLGNQLIVEACAKWPELPSLTLAKKLVADNHGVWSNVNAARMTILRRRGRTLLYKNGKKTRIKDVVPSSCPDFQHNPYRLPKADKETFAPFILKHADTARIGVIADTHIPYFSEKALELEIGYFKQKNITHLLINGDFLDFYQISRFDKDPRKRHIKSEIEMGNQILDVFDDEFPNAIKIFKEGNHDERLAHYVAQKAPEIFDLKGVADMLYQQLFAGRENWTYVGDKRPIYIGPLNVIHGHEYRTGFAPPVNAARGLFLKTNDVSLVAHHHQTSQNNKQSIRGRLISTWSMGCSCLLHPEFMPLNDWNLGFVYIENPVSNDFKIENLRIINNEIMP